MKRLIYIFIFFALLVSCSDSSTDDFWDNFRVNTLDKEKVELHADISYAAAGNYSTYTFTVDTADFPSSWKVGSSELVVTFTSRLDGSLVEKKLAPSKVTDNDGSVAVVIFDTSKVESLNPLIYDNHVLDVSFEFNMDLIEDQSYEGTVSYKETLKERGPEGIYYNGMPEEESIFTDQSFTVYFDSVGLHIWSLTQALFRVDWVLDPEKIEGENTTGYFAHLIGSIDSDNCSFYDFNSDSMVITFDISSYDGKEILTNMHLASSVVIKFYYIAENDAGESKMDYLEVTLK